MAKATRFDLLMNRYGEMNWAIERGYRKGLHVLLKRTNWIVEDDVLKTLKKFRKRAWKRVLPRGKAARKVAINCGCDEGYWPDDVWGKYVKSNEN